VSVVQYSVVGLQFSVRFDKRFGAWHGSVSLGDAVIVVGGGGGYLCVSLAYTHRTLTLR
jgi:hypothetical protein